MTSRSRPLAELARLSPYHFSRSFKRSFGMPPHRYHANRRIERAKQLLANRELSITTIALDIGFSETSTFTAAFHRLTGPNPEPLSSQSRLEESGVGAGLPVRFPIAIAEAGLKRASEPPVGHLVRFARNSITEAKGPASGLTRARGSMFTHFIPPTWLRF